LVKKNDCCYPTVSVATRYGPVHVRDLGDAPNHALVNDLINTINKHCRGGNPNVEYDGRPTAGGGGTRRTLKRRSNQDAGPPRRVIESRSLSSICGFADPSANVLMIPQASFVNKKQKKGKPKKKFMTNRPIEYALHIAGLIAKLRSDPLLFKLLTEMDKLVKEKYPTLHRHIMANVPSQYRLFSGLCFTYLGKTGGTKGTWFGLSSLFDVGVFFRLILFIFSHLDGFCKVHRDQYSIVNGIFQFGCPLYGGTTLFFESDKITQMCGIEHVHGRYILSAFDRIYHGASEVSGVALLVVVVVVVVLPFDTTEVLFYLLVFPSV